MSRKHDKIHYSKHNRKGCFSHHHIWNKVNGGTKEPENMLLLKQEKHNLLHILFGNLDFYDIILLLIRTAKLKHYEKINPNMKKLYKLV